MKRKLIEHRKRELLVGLARAFSQLQPQNLLVVNHTE